LQAGDIKLLSFNNFTATISWKMTEEKILTLHPLGKSGKNILKEKYDVIKATIITALHGRELSHNELTAQIVAGLTGKFEGNIGWYTETVKLDLEARGLIIRTSDKPQKYKLSA